MELALAMLGNAAVAIAIVVAKGNRKKGTTTEEIDREQISRIMTQPRDVIEQCNSGTTTAFQWFSASSRGLCPGGAVGLQCQGTAGRGPQEFAGCGKKSSIYVAVWPMPLKK